MTSRRTLVATALPWRRCRCSLACSDESSSADTTTTSVPSTTTTVLATTTTAAPTTTTSTTSTTTTTTVPPTTTTTIANGQGLDAVGRRARRALFGADADGVVAYVQVDPRHADHRLRLARPDGQRHRLPRHRDSLRRLERPVAVLHRRHRRATVSPLRGVHVRPGVRAPTSTRSAWPPMPASASATPSMSCVPRTRPRSSTPDDEFSGPSFDIERRPARRSSPAPPTPTRSSSFVGGFGCGE